jgi:2-hydroxychromene-2-carboxylate isomerase
VELIFNSIWTTGQEAAHGFEDLCAKLKVKPEQLALAKDVLRRNTDEAASRGVFGVPSFVIDGEVFWGADALDFARAFLADPSVVRNDETHRLDRLPVGASR